MRYITTLTIAGSDSSGGAGVQADLKTMSALGCYAASVITSITAQNTLGVKAVQNVKPSIISQQIRAVMDDLSPEAVKIGMVNDLDTLNAICDTLSSQWPALLVVDPVMVATSGDRLMQADTLKKYCERLVPRATLLTPNIPEAEILAGMPIKNEADMRRAAETITHMGCHATLVKGGHANGEEKTDLLLTDDGQCIRLTSPTVRTNNTHGTGCTLSSAITAFLAQGENLPTAVRKAKAYVGEALRHGADVAIGHGHGPVNHFFNPQKLIKR